ncbi:hypothetical protein BV22DRAFT_1037766 [Leucogyrophana mollusca]|uniref:Uncharacterized protein n=1 Tax=Leucogyrophana mollusca TaxID=85980 RepID=A0ACB8BBL0_9AGAM|nr:hypothetical protein BV22DRAFT_1037766 [Leucogyrophana mollusca]
MSATTDSETDKLANAVIGALMIGSLAMTFAFGIATIQTYHYYRNYPNDPAWLKSLVTIVLLCIVGHSIAVLSGMYTISVTDFDQIAIELLGEPLPRGFSASVLLSGFLGSAAQGYFAQRVYAFSGGIRIPIVCWALSALRFAGSVALAAGAFKGVSMPLYANEYAWLITTLLAMGAVNDGIIAGNMCYYLKSERNFVLRMGRSARSVDQMIMYTIETGLITGLTAVVILILFLSMRNSLDWFAVFLVFGQIFANTFLASLNARKVRTDINETVISLPCVTTLRSGTALDTVRLPGRLRRAPKGGLFPTPSSTGQNGSSSSAFDPTDRMFSEPPIAPGIVVEVSKTTATDAA